MAKTFKAIMTVGGNEYLRVEVPIKDEFVVRGETFYVHNLLEWCVGDGAGMGRFDAGAGHFTTTPRYFTVSHSSGLTPFGDANVIASGRIKRAKMYAQVFLLSLSDSKWNKAFKKLPSTIEMIERTIVEKSVQKIKNAV